MLPPSDTLPQIELRGFTPSLLTPDLQATIDFYETKLGFTRTAAHPDHVSPTWVELSRDGVVFQFYCDPPLGMPDRPVMSGTLYIMTRNVRALATEFSANGVELLWGPEVMDYGQREVGIRDPSGYVLAFAEPA